MKKSGLLLVISIILCSLILAACSGTKLDKPTNAVINDNTQIITWDSVENATGYQVEINGGTPVDVPVSTFPFEDLEPGDYDFRIRAVGDGHKNSDWLKLDTYKKLPRLPFMLRLINFDKEYEVYKTGTATGDIVIPDNHPDGRPITSIAEAAFFYGSNNRGMITSVVMGDNITTIGPNAFQMQKLQSVSIGKNVTTISKLAFAYCASLESIEIPDNVTEIGESAFIGCTSLESIKIGSGISTLNQSIFELCKNLKEIEIPGTVKNINAKAFKNCSGLETVEIKNGMTSVGEEAFSECTSLNSLTISDSVTSIDAYAFFNCKELESANLGRGITKLGAYAFNKTGMWLKAEAEKDLVYADAYVVGVTDKIAATKMIRPETLGIGDAAFKEWTAMTSMTIPETVKFIGEHAFNKCESLVSLNIPAEVVTIGNYAFRDCAKLETVTISNGSKLLRVGAYAFQETALYKAKDPKKGTESSRNGIVIIDNKWVVQTIPDETRQKGYIKNVALPATIEGIADCAFTGCDNITSVQFGSSSSTKLRSIGDFAFNNSELFYTFNQPDFDSRHDAYMRANPESTLTDGIDAVGAHIIPDTVEYIGNYAFHSVTGIRRLELGTGVKIIGKGAFRNSWRMRTVTIPNNVESIGAAAFYGCLQVQTVRIGNGVKYIGDYAFNDMAELRSVEYAEGIKNTGNYAFGGCAKLEIVTLPSTLETIGDGAFYKCTKLPSISIPESVTSIGSAAFYNCTSLKNIVLPQNITSIADYAFYNCNSLESIDIPEKVTHIGFYSFYKCSNAKSLNIKEGLISIDSYAFFGCSYFSKVMIPLSVKSIGSHAFRNCTALTNIIIRDTIFKMGSHVFYGCNFMTIYCESESRPESWNTDWNSSYRPVFWNCTLTTDKKSVESIRKTIGSIVNPNALNGIKPPVCEGYTFTGWTYKKGGTTDYSAANVNLAPNDVTLYAIWRPIKYKINFNSNGGNAVDSITADYGSLVNKPGNPTKSNAEFKGWYKDAALEQAWDFDKDTVPVDGITLYAKWEIVE